jgi:hypothetical protein
LKGVQEEQDTKILERSKFFFFKDKLRL